MLLYSGMDWLDALGFVSGCDFSHELALMFLCLSHIVAFLVSSALSLKEFYRRSFCKLEDRSWVAFCCLLDLFLTVSSFLLCMMVMHFVLGAST